MTRADESRLGLGTRAIHAGQSPDAETGAIMVPIYQTSTYVQQSPGIHRGYEYARTQNPTRDALQKCLASLEDAEFGIAFASGCAATSAVLQLFGAGDKIICSDDVYGGTYRLMSKVFARHGMTFSFVDLADSKALSESTFKDASLVWLETPSNPLLKVIDIRHVVDLAHAAGALVAVDNTFMTPCFQRPLSVDADLVVHSTTKYLNGHSDAIGGVVVTSIKELADRLYFLQNTIGAVPSPHDCFLVLRGLKTLHLRMERHENNARVIAKLIAEHPAVSKVIYPGLPSHPQHELAKQQATGFGGMISAVLKGGLEAAQRALEKFEIFALAESLGGVESLVEHPAIMTHASVEPHIRKELGIHDGLIRLSVGVEEVDDLKKDVIQALDAAETKPKRRRSAGSSRK